MFCSEEVAHEKMQWKISSCAMKDFEILLGWLLYKDPDVIIRETNEAYTS